MPTKRKLLILHSQTSTMKGLAMHFGQGREPARGLQVFDKIITDRGSVYAVSLAKVVDKESLEQALAQIKNYNKHFKKATHHSYAARIVRDGAIFETKGDDGETGADEVILRILRGNDVVNALVCVSRWYGGVKLYADRFKHIQNATLFAISHGSFQIGSEE